MITTRESAIDIIHGHINNIDPIGPGKHQRFTEASSFGDYKVQGDLYLLLIESVPPGYQLDANHKVQLVPGNTQGARHCLDTKDGVDIYVKKNPSELEGPCLVFNKEALIVEPPK